MMLPSRGEPFAETYGKCGSRFGGSGGGMPTGADHRYHPSSGGGRNGLRKMGARPAARSRTIDIDLGTELAHRVPLQRARRDVARAAVMFNEENSTSSTSADSSVRTAVVVLFEYDVSSVVIESYGRAENR